MNANSAILIAVVIGIAAVVSFASFQYSRNVASSIDDSSVRSIHQNAQIQASDMSNILLAKVGQVSTTLNLLSSVPAILSGNLTGAQTLLDGAQNSTVDFTSAYTLIDGSAIAVASSNQTNLQIAQKQGLTNVSQLAYFKGAKQSGATFVSPTTVSRVTHRTFVVIAQPLYVAMLVGGAQTRVFDGEVAGSIDLQSLGTVLKGQIAPEFQSSIGLIDTNGTVLYSNNANSTGLNLFSAPVQALIPASIVVQFDAFLHASIQGSAGVQNLSYNGTSSTLAYQPVVVRSTAVNNQSESQFLGVLYITAPNVLAAGQAAQISQLNTIADVTIAGIAAAAVVTVLVALRWNGRLGELVDARTADLTAANEQLQERTLDLARANEDLAERDEAQKDFVNIAAHELRTPVQPLVGLTEMMQKSMKNERRNTVELSQLEVDMLTRNSRRLENLTKNLLDVTRIEGGTIRLVKERFDVNDAIREAIAENSPNPDLGTSLPASGASEEVQPKRWQESVDGEIGPALDSETDATETSQSAKPAANLLPKMNGTPIRFSPSAGPLMLDADRTRIFEVVSNLLRNASRHSEGKEVEVSASKKGSEALVTVRDHGNGIDLELLPGLFTKFGSKSPAGFGLGLFIAKSIVEVHGGRIWAENNTDGQGGASFSFTLPCLP